MPLFQKSMTLDKKERDKLYPRPNYEQVVDDSENYLRKYFKEHNEKFRQQQQSKLAADLS